MPDQVEVVNMHHLQGLLRQLHPPTIPTARLIKQGLVQQPPLMPAISAASQVIGQEIAPVSPFATGCQLHSFKSVLLACKADKWIIRAVVYWYLLVSFQLCLQVMLSTRLLSNSWPQVCRCCVQSMADCTAQHSIAWLYTFTNMSNAD